MKKRKVFKNIIYVIVLAFSTLVVTVIVYREVQIANAISNPDSPGDYRKIARKQAVRSGLSSRHLSEQIRIFSLSKYFYERSKYLVTGTRADVLEQLGSPHAVRSGSLLQHLQPIPWRDIMSRDVTFPHPGLKDEIWAHRYGPDLGTSERLDLATYNVIEQERARYTCYPLPDDKDWVASESLIYLMGQFLNESPDYCMALVFELDDDKVVVRMYLVWLISGLY